MHQLAIKLRTSFDSQSWSDGLWNVRFTQWFLFVALSSTLLLSFGCSSEQEPSVDGESVDEEGLRLITRPGALYTIDDLVAVGYKKNKQFEVDLVPGANDIWYGFFQQKDIEGILRFQLGLFKLQYTFCSTIKIKKQIYKRNFNC